MENHSRQCFDSEPLLGVGLEDSSDATLNGSASSEFLEDVLEGLSGQPKTLHCKYFYDERGSKLFDMICELDEYYPTRTEAQITRDNASAIGNCIGSEVVLVEYGSGSSTKTRVLLDHLHSPRAYLPVDISHDHLLRTASILDREYADIEIHPVVADFTTKFDLPEKFADERICVYFPGSTIGNFEVDDAVELLGRIAEQCGPCGSLLIGFDLHKDKATLEAAYNDSLGVTAEFNLNLLHRINRQLDSDFDVEQFEHVAYYELERRRIEVFIESKRQQTVSIAGEKISFAEGERIRSEYSHKYTVDGFAEMAARAGFQTSAVWTDANDYFALMYLTTR